MRLLATFVIAAAAFWAAPHAPAEAASQTSSAPAKTTVDENEQEVLRLMALARYRDALAIAERQLAAAERNSDAGQISAWLVYVGQICEALGDKKSAETAYRRMLANDERAYGPVHPITANSLSALGTLLRNADRLDESLALFKRALAIRERAFGPDDPNVAGSLIDVASIHTARGRFAEADPLLRRANAICDKAFKTDHSLTAKARFSLGSSYMNQGRLAEAEILLDQAMRMFRRVYGEAHPLTLMAMRTLASLLTTAGKPERAVPLLEAVLTIRERANGADHLDTATALDDLGSAHLVAGNFAKAEPLLKRALAIRERTLGRKHLLTADSRVGLAALYLSTKRLDAASPLLVEALAVVEEIRGPRHRDLISPLRYLGWLYTMQGRLDAAERTLKRAADLVAASPSSPLAGDVHEDLGDVFRLEYRFAEAERAYASAVNASERQLGPMHPKVGRQLTKLGDIRLLLERVIPAEQAFRRALAIAVRAPPDAGRATVVSGLGQTLQKQGRFAEAEPLLRDALALQKKLSGAEHAQTAEQMAILASLLADRGEIAEAERLYRQALAMSERIVGPDAPLTGTIVNHLGVFVADQGQVFEAELLFRRSLAISRKVFGPDSVQSARDMLSLASVYRDQHRPEAAEPLLKQAARTFEKHLGSTHRETTATLALLAEVYTAQRRFREAIDLLTRVLAIDEQTLGGSHPAVAQNLLRLGRANYLADNLSAAEAQLNHSLAIATEIFPTGHIARAQPLEALALTYMQQGRLEDAHRAAKGAVTFLANQRATAAAAVRRGGTKGLISYDGVFAIQIDTAYQLAQRNRAAAPGLRLDALRAAQMIGFDDTSDALSRTAARFAAGSDAFGKLLREQDALLLTQERVNWQLAVARASKDSVRSTDAQALSKLSADTSARLAAIDAILRRDHAGDYELMAVRALAPEEIQRLLKPDEAIVVLVPTAAGTFTFAITDRALEWSKSRLRAKQMGDRVLALRTQLDPDNWQGTFAPFDRSMAFTTYRELFASVEQVIKDKAQLFLVANGELASLPLSVLVTESPEGGAAGDADPATLRETAWLIKRHALINLPSVSNLKALRANPMQSAATEPFIGFGDPIFGPTPDRTRTRRTIANIHRGSEPNLEELRQLVRLPATGMEVRALAKALGASETADVYLGERATEAQIKSLNLSRKRVVALATHGFLAGDLGAGEPGLAFSTPRSATAKDNGYLSASEAAGLNLHADWVILSACNTAAGNQPGAKGFSGLARAFFLAGAKSLLVSHWPVWDGVAPMLTTRTVTAFQADPQLGRAGALRKAMLELMANKGDPLFAHPAAWAPFVLAGETSAN